MCAAFAAYAVFSNSFFGLLTGFLLYIILWLGPWCAIYLVVSFIGLFVGGLGYYVLAARKMRAERAATPQTSEQPATA